MPKGRRCRAKTPKACLLDLPDEILTAIAVWCGVKRRRKLVLCRRLRSIVAAAEGVLLRHRLRVLSRLEHYHGVPEMLPPDDGRWEASPLISTLIQPRLKVPEGAFLQNAAVVLKAFRSAPFSGDCLPPLPFTETTLDRVVRAMPTEFAHPDYSALGYVFSSIHLRWDDLLSWDHRLDRFVGEDDRIHAQNIWWTWFKSAPLKNDVCQRMARHMFQDIVRQLDGRAWWSDDPVCKFAHRLQAICMAI